MSSPHSPTERELFTTVIAMVRRNIHPQQTAFIKHGRSGAAGED